MTAATRKVGPVGNCPGCGHHSAYALMYPVFAYGTEGGSSDFDQYECADCGNTWPCPTAGAVQKLGGGS